LPAKSNKRNCSKSTFSIEEEKKKRNGQGNLCKKKGRPDPAPLFDTQRIDNLPAIPPATTTTAATATITATITEAAAGASFLRPSFVHGEVTSIEIRAVQRLNSFLGFVGIRHFDETKAAGTAGKLIGNHPRGFNLPVRREDLLKLRIGGRVRQATNINFTTHVLSLSRNVMVFSLRT
jgi:hypothetical protein